MALSINIMVCLPPSSEKLRREKYFNIGKGASQKHTAPATVGEGHCTGTGTPPIHFFRCSLFFYPFTQKQIFFPEKLTNSPQTTRRHTPESSNLRRTFKLYFGVGGGGGGRYEAVHWIHLALDREFKIIVSGVQKAQAPGRPGD